MYMPGQLEIRADFPPKLLPIMEQENRRRYYVAYGGRDSAKSWTFGRAAILQAIRDPLRILCAREVMRTIADSVHRLLTDQIVALNAGLYFDVLDSSITGKNDAEVLYAGLRQQDAHKIKSYEGVDITWVEEAHNVSKKSWDILIPTIRADGSEIWATFNPELDSDDTYKRFVVSPPANAWVQKVTWRDNPWASPALAADREKMKREDPDSYDNIWEGNPRTVVEGAIYAREVTKMIQDGRVRPIPHDPKLPVHTIWDLGWNDAMSIILVQKPVPSAVSVIGYIEDRFKTYAEYVAQLNQLGYVWGDDWLPHDGENKDPKDGKSAKQVLTGLQRRVKIIPRSDVESGIKAVRMMFPRVYMDDRPATETTDGYVGAGRLLECLKRYRRAVPQNTGEPASPVHDEYSHGADAWRGLAMVVDKLTNENENRRRITVQPHRSLDPGTGI